MVEGLFPDVTSRAVRLPESFRGGCSFGAGLLPFPEAADLSRRDF
jgi:hypothetical protein